MDMARRRGLRWRGGGKGGGREVESVRLRVLD